MNEVQNLFVLIRKAIARMDFEFNHLPDFGNDEVSDLVNQDYSIRRKSLLSAIEVIEKADMSQGVFTKEVCQQLPLSDYSFVFSLIDQEISFIQKNAIDTATKVLLEKGYNDKIEPTLKNLYDYYWTLVDSKYAFVNAYNTHCLS